MLQIFAARISDNAKVRSVADAIPRVRGLLRDDATLFEIIPPEQLSTASDDGAALCKELLQLFNHKAFLDGKLKRLLRNQ